MPAEVDRQSGYGKLKRNVASLPRPANRQTMPDSSRPHYDLARMTKVLDTIHPDLRRPRWKLARRTGGASATPVGSAPAPPVPDGSNPDEGTFLKSFDTRRTYLLTFVNRSGIIHAG